ncbi:hypothetical protein Hena1_00450 [Erwinia phage Hena1]|uniref:Uncharacterized protein n=1 Tax=Erwinia phage Hena1 TaxID=2678601 RepID=A0A6B9J5N1_9CAUD|nr:hypothetical protein HWC84_gp044 [Erwinia phage Hena1]QGZ16221.1 hypothetical protein Hena1_00450 [Erwinia phage Hena1]
MAKRTAEQIEVSKTELANEFMSLVLPRVMESYTETLESSLENLRAVQFLSIKKADAKPVEELLVKQEAKMAKILSGEPAEAIRKFYVAELVAGFSEEELQMAVLQERFTVKFTGLTARAESVLKEALGEV